MKSVVFAAAELFLLHLSGESNRPLTPILWKVSRYTSHFSRDTFAEACPPLGRKVAYTPPICITIRVPFVSQYFAGVLGSAGGGTPINLVFAAAECLVKKGVKFVMNNPGHFRASLPEERVRADFWEGGVTKDFSAKKTGLQWKWGEAIQWIRGLVSISTGKAIQWRDLGHSLNRRTLKTEKLLSSSHARKSALKEEQQNLTRNITRYSTAISKRKCHCSNLNSASPSETIVMQKPWPSREDQKAGEKQAKVWNSYLCCSSLHLWFLQLLAFFSYFLEQFTSEGT